jgi:soluble lytic murein transglycosylase-like protein
MRLVYGIALTESGDRQTDANGRTIMGQPNPSGELAIGRMQLLPSTAKMLGVNPYDAQQNRIGGEEYFAKLLRQHGGNVGDALADYGGASGGQYSAKGQDYIRKVESAGGISIGTIIVNSSPNLTPEQHQAAIKKGVREGLDQHVQQQMAELNGAYQ